MKNFICKYAVKLGSCMAALAVMATALTVNTTCVWFSHQENFRKQLKSFESFDV